MFRFDYILFSREGEEVPAVFQATLEWEITINTEFERLFGYSLREICGVHDMNCPLVYRSAFLPLLVLALLNRFVQLQIAITC